MEARQTFRNFIESPTLKAFIIGVLALILWGASFFIYDIIRERSNLQTTAEREIAEKWGGSQHLTGPVITIPYHHYEEVEYVERKKKIKKQKKVTDYLNIFPNTLNVDTEIIPAPRKRGIYEVNTYTSNSVMKGQFSINLPKEEGYEYDLEKAVINFGISDPKGISALLEGTINNETYSLTPNNKSSRLVGTFFGAKINLKDKKEIKYHVELPLKGTNDFNVVPTAIMTTFKTNSTWPHPKFDGSSLPVHREVSENGFTAEWTINDVSGKYMEPSFNLLEMGYDLEKEAVSVELIKPVNEYTKNFRSIKYALLTIVLTFLAFFLIEIINKLKIHPIQYLLVGTGLVIYYALLVALSEHIGFNLGYILASIVILSLTTFYAYHMIGKGVKFALIIGGLVAGIYGFVFFTLQLEKFALLFGSIGLVVILGITMFITRNINWYDTKSE